MMEPTATAPLRFEPLRFEGESLVTKPITLQRAKVPGGWLVLLQKNVAEAGITFVPDPEHCWDGGSLR